MKELDFYFEDGEACPCREAFEAVEPWEALKNKSTLLKFSQSTIEGEVHQSVIISGPVKIGTGTVISPYVVIEGPVMIGKDCTIRPFTLIRPGTIIGDGCVIGNGSEIKNAIVFNEAKIASQTFVGDSILGKGVRVGSGTILANRRFDQKEIHVTLKGKKISVGSDKFGAVIGDYVRLGANCVTMPGTIIGKHTWVVPGACLNGFYEKEKLIKMQANFEIVDKERQVLSHLDKEGKV
ncbi:hypothetical protein HZC32_02435 [Candidatus Woesearchaeota archaeon]|nr:hypothetical protein [Candidatus Woesearchaeota archaeon]